MLLLCIFTLPQLFLSTTSHSLDSVKNSTTLDFDDTPTFSGLGTLPSTYHHLAFSKFMALAPRSSDLKNYISPNDFNCAVSAPNAILGSRTPLRITSDSHSTSQGTKGAYFSIANATSMIESGLEPHFTLLSFNIKPMDAPPPPPTTITVRGYSHSRNESDPFNWQVDFPAGYHLHFLVKMQEYSGEAWDQLYEVEILADYGEDELDWEFCLDDLEVQFFKTNGTASVPKISTVDQALLGVN